MRGTIEKKKQGFIPIAKNRGGKEPEMQKAGFPPKNGGNQEVLPGSIRIIPVASSKGYYIRRSVRE